MAPLLPIVLGLAQFAPQVMRYFGAGEASAAVAEKVVGIAQAVTGTASPEAALQALQANQAAQAEFNLRLLAASQELEQAYLADRQDARQRDIELAKLGKHNARADIMVAVDALGLVACLLVLGFFRKEIPGEVVSLLSTIAGIFGLCLRDAHQFEFGSSRGSREKDELLVRRPLA